MSSRTHGQSKTPEFRVWTYIKNRCYNRNDPKFRYYGARGIRMCDRWKDFTLFLADMGRRPFAGATIDRKDNDGNYEPNNCQWSSKTAQARNRRTNNLLTFEGKTQCVTQWAEITGLPTTTIYQRKLAGWSDAETLTIPHILKPKPKT